MAASSFHPISFPPRNFSHSSAYLTYLTYVFCFSIHLCIRASNNKTCTCETLPTAMQHGPGLDRR